MRALLLSGVSVVLASAASAQDFSYSGEAGPDNWGGTCAAGMEQSPVDFAHTMEAEGVMPALAWGEAESVDITRDSLNFTVHTDAGSLILNGTRYDLIQFHFHSLSEHTVDNEHYPLEVHFVHAAENGNLAVVGIFFEEGEYNYDLASIWNAIPEAGEEGTIDYLNFYNFLPSDLNGYRYAGSLTTPPCSEIVQWTVFSEPLEASAEQIAAYQQLFGDTARPTMPTNRRFILETN